MRPLIFSAPSTNILVVFFSCLALLLSQSNFCTAFCIWGNNNHVTLKRKYQKRSYLPIVYVTATRLDYDAESLQELTLKELKQMVKDSDFNERGLLSRLKRKQDFIDFLEQISNKQTKIKDIEQSGDTQTIAHVIGDGQQQQQQEQLQQHKEISDVSSSSIDSNNAVTPSSSSSPSPQINGNQSNNFPAKFQRGMAPVYTRVAAYQKIYEMYPPSKDEDCTGIGEEDIRQKYHPIFANSTLTSSDMDIVFMGTASCTPGLTRSVSCTAVRLNWKRRSIRGAPPGAIDDDGIFDGGTWLFDVGEGTQLQVQRTPSVKPGKISKIFITHAHGDHSFGLPGLLCLMGQDRNRNSPPVDIYGPVGLRMWLRVAIRYSVSRIVPSYRVHELRDIPMAPEWHYVNRHGRFAYRGLKKIDPTSTGGNDRNIKSWNVLDRIHNAPKSWMALANNLDLPPSKQYGEVEEGRDIYPIYNHELSADGAPVWEVADEGDVKVYAAPMSHGIPCVGYVIEEKARPGRLRDEFVEPIVKRNLDALKDAGFSIPMKAMAVIKNLPIGSAFTFPDGTVVTQEDALEPSRRGRKVVICGDTSSARALGVLAKGADVVIHEATNAYLPSVDKDTNIRTVTREAIRHGHSTPALAGRFARRVGAKQLLLNHFSARYKGDQSAESLTIMTQIEEQAAAVSGLGHCNVAAAWDFMILPVARPD